MADEFTRGVENPRIIDLITTDAATGEVVLLIQETRPWGADPKQIAQLEEKLDRYFVYILDGYLAEQYPQYSASPIRIQMDSATEPEGMIERILLAAQRYARAQGLAFTLSVTPPDAD